jgi:hypothetical protein
MKRIFNILAIALFVNLSACKKFVQVGDPKDELASATVFTNDATATAAVVGIYSDMNAYNYQFANVLTSFLGSMSADDFAYAATFANFDEFKNNAISPGNPYVSTLWAQPYDFIYRANVIIEGASASTNLSPAVKNQVLGEAYFVRAFCHFYLVNLFGDVPLILDTDVRKNTDLPRSPKADVYSAVISDLKEAKNLLVNTYAGNGERTRPNKAAATLLLARAYLYTEQNELAEQEATNVISTTGYGLLDNADPSNAAHISKVFLKNSNEAVWQLQVVNTALGRNTWEGNTIVPVSSPLYRMTKDTYGIIPAFEAGDRRLANWVGTYAAPATPTNILYYPFKYKIRVAAGVAPTEYSMVLRFAEAYLIRAEARIQQQKYALGREDLNKIRTRAGLGDLPVPTTVPEGMAMVEQERRVELFGEWGHRWFDLKRWKSVTGIAGKTRADDVLPLTKPAWKSTAQLFPIPTDAFRSNVYLTPNPGYTN